MSAVSWISVCSIVTCLVGCDGFDVDAAIDAGTGGAPGRVSFTDIAAGDRFGAALAIDGTTVVAGAPGTDPEVSGSSTGAVYVFTLSAATLTLDQTLAASDASDFDAFGSALALSGDTLAIGAPGADPDQGTGNGTGAVYIFSRAGGSWTEQTKLASTLLGDGDSFGASVALAGDTLLVGASGDDARGNEAGAIYLFQRSGTDWLPQP
jgi:hypothetical protein